MERFLRATDLPTPFLVLDRAVVADRYRAFATAFPGAAIHYAVKACPEPAVLDTLVALGSSFDVASPTEIRLAVAAGADPAALCFGNPVRSAADVAAAWTAGVRRFVTDSIEDLDVLATHAAGSQVLVRLLVSDAGSATPFAAKFGASPDEAIRLLSAAARRGLRADGIAFHAGSQQSRPDAFAEAVGTAVRVASRAGMRRPVLDVGGGFPVAYRSPVPCPDEFAGAIAAAVDAAVRAGHIERAELMLEPGRALVADAGVLRA